MKFTPRTRTVLACLAVLAAAACGDAAGPRAAEPTLRIVPVADSVFEGDVVSLSARVFDGNGAEIRNARVTWSVGDSSLAKVSDDGRVMTLQPGVVRITARSGLAADSFDLAIGRLVVKRIEVTPTNLHLGRGDRLMLAASVFGQGDRVINGRTIAFSSDDTLIAAVGGVGFPPNYLRATGAGSTRIRATADGVTGTAPADVVLADTVFALTQYNGSPLPVLVAADTVTIDGVKEFDEVDADSGIFVISGVQQKRYQIDVRYTQYHVIASGDSVIRQPRTTPREFDRGMVAALGDGSLALTSEFVYPLAHTAAPVDGGFLVHFQIAGTDEFLDLRYRRIAP